MRYAILTCIPLLAACSATSDEGIVYGPEEPSVSPSQKAEYELKAETPDVACSVDADCSAALACWSGSCVAGACELSPVQSGALCDGGACNGGGACARGKIQTYEIIGGSGHQYGRDVSSLGRGAVVLGAGREDVSGNDGSFLYRNGYAGEPPVRHYAAEGDVLQDAAVLGDDVVLAGCRDGSPTGTEGYDAVVSRVERDGGAAWTTQFGGDGYQCAEHVAVLPGGTVYVAGTFQHELGLAGITSAAPSAFIAAFFPNGQLWWAQTLDATAATVRGLEATTDGLVLAGHFEGTLRIGDRSVHALGGTDAFVTRLSRQGEQRWLVSLGSTGHDVTEGLAVSRHAVAITGHLDGASAFGPSVMVADRDPFVAQLDVDEGEVRWARHFPTDAPVDIAGIAVDDGGDVSIAGSFGGHFEVDAVIEHDALGTDAFVTKLSGVDGLPLWGQVISQPGIQAFTGVATNPSGRVVASGTFEGRLFEDMAHAEGFDGFVMYLSR